MKQVETNKLLTNYRGKGRKEEIRQGRHAGTMFVQTELNLGNSDYQLNRLIIVIISMWILYMGTVISLQPGSLIM